MNRSRPALVAAGIVLGGFGFGGGPPRRRAWTSPTPASNCRSSPTAGSRTVRPWRSRGDTGGRCSWASATRPASPTPTPRSTRTPTATTRRSAEGPQTGFIFGSGGLAVQTLAGPDATPGNGDDPLLQPNTVYTITVAVGQRLPGAAFSVPYGDLDIRLLAGTNPFLSPIIGESADFIPPAGVFADVTLVVDSATVSPALYGSPLSIAFRQNVFRPPPTSTTCGSRPCPSPRRRP